MSLIKRYIDILTITHRPARALHLARHAQPPSKLRAQRRRAQRSTRNTRRRK